MCLKSEMINQSTFYFQVPTFQDPRRDSLDTFKVFSVLIVESLRSTTRLLMTSQRSLETSVIFRFAPKIARGWRDRARF